MLIMQFRECRVEIMEFHVSPSCVVVVQCVDIGTPKTPLGSNNILESGVAGVSAV